jgi:hypothetical protein
VNGPPSQDDTKHRVDAKIDTLMDKLEALTAQVDEAVGHLAHVDAESVRRAFQERQQSHDDGQ